MITAVIGTESDTADFGFVSFAAAFRQFDSVSNGIPDQVDEGIRNLLNDVVVQFGFAARKVEFDLLAGGFRGVTNGARQSRIQRANGHHARSGDFVLQMVSEFGEFVDIAFDAPDEAAHLGEDFVYVSGNFCHRTRENVDVVVTIHFQFAEFRPEGSVARGRVGQHLRRWRSALRKRPTSGIDAIEFVLFLELGDFALQAFFRKAERFDEALEFGDAPDHSRTVDDQFADGVHHAVKPRQRNAHGFCRVDRLLFVASADASRRSRCRPIG